MKLPMRLQYGRIATIGRFRSQSTSGFDYGIQLSFLWFFRIWVVIEPQGGIDVWQSTHSSDDKLIDVRAEDLPQLRASLQEKARVFKVDGYTVTHAPDDEITAEEAFDELIRRLNLSPEPTSQQIADACADTLSPEDCAHIANQLVREALEYAYTCLAAAGEEPHEYLASKGIIRLVHKVRPKTATLCLLRFSISVT
ncbi:MAG TPA: hypothetical protein VNG90_01615 [Candidatus Acidoferrum sp.]|nr:hypothetical protein [Candidatus Acidoferrum sp.]